MKFTSLDAWLNWQASLNPAEIDLGLERVSRVLQSMGHASHYDCPFIMVAGTNGKGSVVALLESIARASGYRTGCYTSPHITRYNERIRINGECINDQALCDAFERVDQARDTEQLTYFEFGTLAAIDIFKRANVDLVIMEVGLGGRLDAVNIMQPDVSVITTIAIDHTDWLGATREQIGYEKAGIMRENGIAICGDKDPPKSLLDFASKQNTRLFISGRDFSALSHNRHWSLQSPFTEMDELPVPSLHGAFQLNNAATAIVALQALASRLQCSRLNIETGLSNAHLPGRYQRLYERPRVIVDVAHNPQAVASLVEQLKAEPVEGITRVVIAMLADKPVDEVIALMKPLGDYWYTAGLETEARGLGSEAMARKVRDALVEHEGADVKLRPGLTVADAIGVAMHDAAPQDRIVIFGSFYTVAAAIHYFT